MSTQPLATVVSSHIPAVELAQITGALSSAGFERIAHVERVEDAVQVEKKADDTRELRVLPPLVESQLIVLDNSLHGYSSFDVLRMLKSREETQHIPVAMLSPSVTDLQVVWGWMAGFDLFLSRPVNPAELEKFARRLRQAAAEAA